MAPYLVNLVANYIDPVYLVGFVVNYIEFAGSRPIWHSARACVTSYPNPTCARRFRWPSF